VTIFQLYLICRQQNLIAEVIINALNVVSVLESDELLKIMVELKSEFCRVLGLCQQWRSRGGGFEEL
jgi:hypothetical protein